jgi:hypothetical protein
MRIRQADSTSLPAQDAEVARVNKEGIEFVMCANPI